MFKAILTDLGQVVCTFDRAIMVDNFQTLYPDKDRKILELVLFGPKGPQYLKKFELGIITPDTYRRDIQALIGSKHEPSEQAFWQAHTAMYQANQPVVDLWRNALEHDPGLRLVAVSDTDPCSLERMLILTGRLFHTITTSYMAGECKPHARIFNFALESAGVAAKECFFTDDLLPNVQAASRLGMATHHYTSPELLAQALAEQGLL